MTKQQGYSKAFKLETDYPIQMDERIGTKKMVGRVGLFRAFCPPPLRGHLPFATMFKFVPDKFVEPTTNGLKDHQNISELSISSSDVTCRAGMKSPVIILS